MTQPLPASPAQASEARQAFVQYAAPRGELLTDPDKIIDQSVVLARIDALTRGSDAPSGLRPQVTDILRDAMAAGRQAIADGFADNPFDARRMTRSYTYLTDVIMIAALAAARHIAASPTSDATPLALIAVGGYGRGEMAPASDVDLLFLTSGRMPADTEAVIEAMLYILWDLRLKVGHASRTIKDCIKLGGEDFTIRTSLLEHRLITGPRDLSDELATRLRNDLFANTAREFVEAKLTERERRHERQGARYMVEPNVKEGKGGLRDLQSLYWIAKYTQDVTDIEDLVAKDVFSPEELKLFVRAEDFLWAVRGHLHLITGRPTEKLSFDLQVEVADRMGYQDKGGRRAVEVFMQDYFRNATAVGDLTRILLSKLEASTLKPEPLLERLFKLRPQVKPGYQVIHNRLAIEDEEAFIADKLNLLRLFGEGLRTGMLLHPDAMRLVTANLHLIDDAMRRDPEANRIFLDLLLEHGNPERALRRMNELGLLSAFIPDFEPIVAMMQFNMYHSYTVDEHIIQCISQLAMIEKEELTDDLPVSSEILQSGLNRRVLYVAMLLHDIGKGREMDHSILGAQIARRLAPRLGLNKEESETVEWLVRYHLLMSDMAQKRDIADPRTVRDFAKAVKTVKRLDLLLVLTTCDIRGVGPDTWNNWKAALLRALYRQTRRALDGGMEALTRENRGEEAKKALAAALPDWSEDEMSRELDRHYDPYWQGLHVTAHEDFARLLHDLQLSGDESRIEIKLFPDDDRDATRACCVMADHPGIFARLAGALALVGANVVDARSYTTKDGYVTDAFWIQDAEGRPYEAARLPRLTQMIQKTLKGEVVAREALKSRDKIKKREKAFRVPTTITFDNDGSEIYTIIEVDTRDRPGLLYDLTRALTAANVYIANAVIATYGEQAVDSFYVKDMFGLKYYSQSKQKTLEAKLRRAIEEGAERADT
ncbi:MAG: [protein-PII] uridylyltransferase [Rhodobacteraceae bacterium]|nr:[protein-PII] uridylyltransferase [Paracoccaceae bacterium]